MTTKRKTDLEMRSILILAGALSLSSAMSKNEPSIKVSIENSYRQLFNLCSYSQNSSDFCFRKLKEISGDENLRRLSESYSCGDFFIERNDENSIKIPFEIVENKFSPTGFVYEWHVEPYEYVMDLFYGGVPLSFDGCFVGNRFEYDRMKFRWLGWLKSRKGLEYKCRYHRAINETAPVPFALNGRIVPNCRNSLKL